MYPRFRCWTRCWMYLRAYKIYKKKEDKHRVGRCWMKFFLDQTFRPTFYGSSNQIFILNAFDYRRSQARQERRSKNGE